MLIWFRAPLEIRPGAGDHEIQSEFPFFLMQGSENIRGNRQRRVEPGNTINDPGDFVVPSGARVDGFRMVCNDMAGPMEDIVLRSAPA
jgi:hypothetical protein